MLKISVLFLSLFLFVPVLHAAIQGEEVNYEGGGVKMKGFLAYDDAVTGKRPGVLVVHEWWGHNEYSRSRARQLAGMGYTALAVDMYGDGKTAAHPDDAGKFAGEVGKNMEAARARFEAAMKALQQHKTVDPAKIAAIGYCFGGSVVLEMARMGLDLKGVASFHGGLTLSTPAQAGKVKARVLVCNGAADSFIPADQIAAFKKDMDAAKVDYEFIDYPGAKHSFTNPDADEYAKKFGMPIAYNKEADQKSWADLTRFLKEIFAK